MQPRSENHERKGGGVKAALSMGMALGLVAGMTLSAQAKTHEVKMTAVETDIVIDGGGEKWATLVLGVYGVVDGIDRVKTEVAAWDQPPGKPGKRARRAKA